MSGDRGEAAEGGAHGFHPVSMLYLGKMVDVLGKMVARMISMMGFRFLFSTWPAWPITIGSWVIPVYEGQITIEKA